ncbi:hypothetical protein ABZ805_13190 [Saccharopolyspora sp. NPDC047091]|uniref:hypothetical protein n=1 Tax=Saccharopolyspora sp. NPDC047091 TaxID=3155924 RepID=UPI0033E35069
MVSGRRTRPVAVAAAVLAIGLPAISAGEPDAIRLKHERAWVDSGPLEFGAEPHAAVRAAAADAAAGADCAVDVDTAARLVLAPTWPEVAASGSAPAPMTLSRYDDGTALADPGRRSPGIFFSPGVGAWQLDSAGLGATATAAAAIDTGAAARTVAPHVVGRYCAELGDGSSPAAARAAAWSSWYACDEGACEDVYQRLLDEGVVEDGTVGRHGGADPRRCHYAGATHDCAYVDPAAAQGDEAWRVPGYGPAPVPDPFYVLALGGEEVRYWLAVDTGAGTDVVASRELGADARESLRWSAGAGLCDRTAHRGRC